MKCKADLSESRNRNIKTDELPLIISRGVLTFLINYYTEGANTRGGDKTENLTGLDALTIFISLLSTRTNI